MTAVILAFPPRSPIRALSRASDGSAPFTPAWCQQHLPLVEAIEADDEEFARPCQTMRDGVQ